MLLDPKTLSLAIGYGNLLFALLVTVYVGQASARQPPLNTWRWAKLVVGIGLLLTVAGTRSPGMASAVMANCILLLGGTLELAAYLMLLGRSGWRIPLVVYAVCAMGSVAMAALLSGTHHARIVAFMLAAAIPYLVIPLILLRDPMRNRLSVTIAFFDLLLACALLARGLHGLVVEELVRLGTHWTTTAVYAASYTGLLINGFGFLLLAKQGSDRELAGSVARLQASEAAQRQLLAMASHEFRTPAAIIRSSLDSLRLLPDTLSPDVERRLEQMRNASTRMVDLSNALITQERLVQQAFEAKIASCNLSELVQDVVACYRDHDRPTVGIRLPDTAIVLPADESLIRIALHNLIDNAMVYGDAQREAPCVVLRDEGDFVEMHVEDGGSGVPDELKERIFERHFSQRDGLAHGVGLTIVRMIANAHGGRAFVVDRKPQGADFVLTLPKKPPHSPV